jgi:hypothetical protein
MPTQKLQQPELSNSQNTPNPSQSFLINGRRSLFTVLNKCPKAQTLLGFSPDEMSYVIAELPCQNWSCRSCAERKIRRLAALTRDAKPTRMLTLTVDPGRWPSPRAAFDGTRRQVNELLKKLRTKFGPIEYLRVTELTKKGFPHYHLLLRSGFIPHAVVKQLWNDLTGATIVDLRQVKESFRAYTYLVKYLSKLHKIEWTERHVSYSKGFFPPEPERKNEPLAIESKSILPMHPITYLLQNHPGDRLEPFTPSTWIIREARHHDDF